MPKLKEARLAAISVTALIVVLPVLVALMIAWAVRALIADTSVTAMFCEPLSTEAATPDGAKLAALSLNE